MGKTSQGIFRIVATHGLGAIYFFALCYVYIAEMQPIFGYLGFEGSFDLYRALLGYVLTVVFLAYILNCRKAQGFFLSIIYCFFFVPTAVYFSCGAGTGTHLLLMCSGVFIVCAASSIQCPEISISEGRIEQYVKALTALIALYFISVILQGGLQNFNLDLADVYIFREDAANQLHPIYSYISPAVGKIAIPMLAAIGMHLRKNSLVVLAAIAGIMQFGLTSHKGPAVYIFLTLTIYLLAKKGKPTTLIALMAVGVSLAELDFVLSRNLDYVPWFSALMVQRVLMTPPLLDGYFIEYFGAHEHYFWAMSKISLGLVSTKYIETSPYVIGSYYFGDDSMSANTGWIGSGFAEAGVIGILIYSVFIGCLISILSGQARKIGPPLVIGISAPLFLSICVSVDPMTALLTHGLVVLLVALFAFPRQAPLLAASKL